MLIYRTMDPSRVIGLGHWVEAVVKRLLRKNKSPHLFCESLENLWVAGKTEPIEQLQVKGMGKTGGFSLGETLKFEKIL
jgi:hypothetical protein